jgi:hypothetical protein
MTETDNHADFLVAFCCCVGLFGWIAYEAGSYNTRTERTYCAATLADGRELRTRWINETGDYRCTYSPGIKKSRRA